ncbi:NUDIX hydrolase [Candidatus Micrarchaeota archaeon]|nr:NUDIX hydrolase [Candidatus Micrarchaeota archaeon]
MNYRTIVSGAIIHPETGKVLIVKRTNTKKRGGKWELPGGKIEVLADGKLRERHDDALFREIKEETNLDAEKLLPQPVHDFEYVDGEYRRNFYVFLTRPTGKIRVKLNPEEHTKYAWVAKNELTKYGLNLGFRNAIIKAFNAHKQMQKDFEV